MASDTESTESAITPVDLLDYEISDALLKGSNHGVSPAEAIRVLCEQIENLCDQNGVSPAKIIRVLRAQLENLENLCDQMGDEDEIGEAHGLNEREGGK